MASNSAAVSHVGKIRSNNQDSGYAGAYLFVVADGMGGHAGGDVASAIAITGILDTDREYATPDEAEYALASALVSANGRMAETVFDHPELTGMGTTVSGIVVVGATVVLAHIGDSRIYRWRDGELEQITHDHTFVQRLVDSGRITEEEAAVHPRRSVLMRVLGDVDASPEIDTAQYPTKPGDRWLICSDGLSSYVPVERIAHELGTVTGARATADRLIKDSLDHGAPDNVTVVLVDIDESGLIAHEPPAIVGSAALPLQFEGDTGRRPVRLPTLLLHPLKATKPDDSHFEPESDTYLQELIKEDARRNRRRRIWWIVWTLVILLAVAGLLVGAYQWTQTRWYVGAQGTTVAIYQGVQQDLGPIALHHVYEQTSIQIADLPSYTRSAVKQTIGAGSLEEAQRIVERLEP
ncbi:protein phosphatase 2C domain-containing protein [Galbitalea sp. SE-J8]|uniref:PP2C family protein-serine/threonine phosphatase n=1 Tax=Galbitalea sp. SE-J8 TaxID=3054952 RepID=UPI00259D1323|nr:PP2C family serine/threonine-protein phosphatase [Galbitalea sp. SE-J8]MDM4763282.1 protein phosphatase 2C domain-containing protein [Galbitalea sp. SE-J8]